MSNKIKFIDPKKERQGSRKPQEKLHIQTHIYMK